MNEQNDVPSTITLDTVNLQIMTIITDRVLGAVERDEEHAQWLVEFNAAIGAVKGLISREQVYVLESAPWFLAQPFGAAMFMEGLRIARNPLALLTLPEGANER